MKDIAIYWLAFFNRSFMTKFRLSCCGWRREIKVCWQVLRVNLSFLKFGHLRRCKLYGQVYLPCEWIKRNGRTCLFAGQVFRSTYFCCWNHVAADFEFFVLSTLEKYHQIPFSGPWSATYDLDWIKLRKTKSDGLCFRRMFYKKSSLYMSTSSLSLIPRIHAEFSIIIFDRAENRPSTLVWETRQRLWSEVFERKSRLFYDHNIFRIKIYSFIASRIEKNTWSIVKITFSCGNYHSFTSFFLLTWVVEQGAHSRTKDHRNGRLFSNSKQTIYVWNLKLQDYRQEHKSYLQGVFQLVTFWFG